MAKSLVLVVGTLGLSCAVAATALAQEKGWKTGGGMQLGVVAGANIFTFGGSDASGVTSRTAFYAGAALTIPLGANAFVEPQLLYSAEGAKMTVFDSTLATNVTGTFKLAYLRVPVLFGLNFGSAGGVRPRIYAGPAIGIKASCNLEASAMGTSVSSSCTDVDLKMKGVDLGVTGGGGATIPVGRGTISVDARYTLGLTDVYDALNMKNKGFSIGAGFTFPLGGK